MSLPMASGEIIGALLDATHAYSGQTRYEDDFTLLVVKRLPTGGILRCPRHDRVAQRRARPSP
jgi:hypothetical protein